MAEVPERVAILEANYGNLDRRGIEHEKNDVDRFERTFSFVKSMKEEILGGIDDVKEQVTSLREKVDTLWDEKNKREGAFGISKLAAGGVGGIVVAAIEWLAHK